MLNGLDLFSGIGGLTIALNEWVRPIAYCEIDPHCQAVLLNRMGDRTITRSPIWDDIQTFDPAQFQKGTIDIIYGGFPCQDISIAGNGKGLEGKRSGLFFEIVRMAKEIQPSFLFLENVPAITSRGGIRVVKEIAEMGYDCRWCVISAASIGALHRRERWFLLGYTKRNGSFCNSHTQSSKQANKETKSESSKEQTRRGFTGHYWPFESREHWQETVSTVCRASDGISGQVDRLRALGNAVVPQQAKEAFKILMGIET